MKVIFSKNEFGCMCDMSSNVFDSIKEIDCDLADLEFPTLIDSLKEMESPIININVLPSGDVEIEYSEEFCIDTYEFMERATINVLPIIYKIKPVIEKVMGAVEAIVDLFDNKIVDDIKNWFAGVNEDAETLLDKYM